MTTITLKINEKSKKGKAFLALAKVFYDEKQDVELITDKSPYNPKFVAEIKKRAKTEAFIEIDPKNVWENIK